MPEPPRLNHPWLIAVWPGMGHVALNAGIYLLAQLGMTAFAEFSAGELFDVEHVEVKNGLLKLGKRPRNRFFHWTDPAGKHDLVVFLGEAQPPIGKYAFCRQLLSFSKQLSVERVFTFAAMATQMHPAHRSRVFVAATDEESIDELQTQEIDLLEDGHIGGLNGVLLGVAAEEELRGVCLLGEMPQVFSQLPFPKASLAILKVFAELAGITLDFTALAEQAEAMDQHLVQLLSKVEEAYGEHYGQQEEAEFSPQLPEEERLDPADEQRLETLFRQAAQDRTKAFELKQSLDRLGIFKEYEDRFLDLFKKSE